ncbi:hypothetical protein [Spiroplasma turonicum]|uniref:Uncharacterized protein n=1 Tax=Spiroplasma turonicum TaxID=216946 RepID=A0A0K1P5K8_9MOLU|nr:hypothetical protein [Spiroplasma turonicum]AKU79583.1 hypothetical protein STURON_00337 [Spiroplasma turonicum]ALX70605.1 hypothetical protein STURO_v1c03370 [Spiroplasma turonicum]
MRIKSDFYKEIEAEFKIISEKEHLGNGGNAMSNLSTKMFYLSKHQFNSFDDFDQALVTEIANTLQSLEDIIVKKAFEYQRLAREAYHEEIDPQKWIDFAQSEASNLSYEMYTEKELKYLRYFHIVWLTWIFCDEELKKLRTRVSRDLYHNIGSAEKNYVKKRSEILKSKINDDN